MDAYAHRHVVFAPTRIEEHPVAELRCAIRERNDEQLAALPDESLDASAHGHAAGELQIRIRAFAKGSLLPVADRRSESFGVAIFALPFELFVIAGERARTRRAQINRLAGSIHQHLG